MTIKKLNSMYGILLFTCLFPLAAQSQAAERPHAMTGTNVTFSATHITVEQDQAGKVIACRMEDVAFLKGSYRTMSYVTNDLPADLVPTGFDKRDLERIMKASTLIRTIHIFQAQTSKHYEIQPEWGTYSDETEGYSQWSQGRPQPTSKKETIGTETVNGHPCVKQRVTISVNGEPIAEATVWEATDLGGMVIRHETTEPNKGLAVTEVKRISFAPPPEPLFSVPSGYPLRRSTMPIMPKYEDVKQMQVLGLIAGSLESPAPSMNGDNLLPLRLALGTNFAFTANVTHTAKFANGVSVDDHWQRYAFRHGQFRFEHNLAKGQLQKLIMGSGGRKYYNMTADMETELKLTAGDPRACATEIVLPDQHQHYTIFHAVDAFYEREWCLPRRFSQEAKVEKNELGRETIAGHPCVKYQVTLSLEQGPGKRRFVWIDITVWEASDLGNLPIRIERSTGSGVFVCQFNDIKLQPSDRSLFLPPAGCKCYRSKEEFTQPLGEKMKSLMENMQPQKPKAPQDVQCDQATTITLHVMSVQKQPIPGATFTYTSERDKKTQTLTSDASGCIRFRLNGGDSINGHVRSDSNYTDVEVDVSTRHDWFVMRKWHTSFGSRGLQLYGHFVSGLDDQAGHSIFVYLPRRDRAELLPYKQLERLGDQLKKVGAAMSQLNPYSKEAEELWRGFRPEFLMSNLESYVQLPELARCFGDPKQTGYPSDICDYLGLTNAELRKLLSKIGKDNVEQGLREQALSQMLSVLNISATNAATWQEKCKLIQERLNSDSAVISTVFKESGLEQHMPKDKR